MIMVSKDKAYIVANEQQEREVLEKLEREGMMWYWGNTKPTEYIPSKSDTAGADFPYALINRCEGRLDWALEIAVRKLEYDFEIVFDGRKEEQMSDKYVVTQEFMNELKKWKADIWHEWFDKKADGKWLNSADISDLESITEDWWLDTEISYKESNNRLIAIIRWVNGEDVFEVKKTKKWVVRSKERDSDGDYWYVDSTNNLTYIVFYENDATKFDTKEEAESWANSHQEVVEVEE